MPVDSLHPQYEKHAEQWQRCRDAIEGEDAVKAAGKRYLPELPGHRDDPQAYKDYKSRSLFLEAAGRTHQGLSGAVFRKDPSIEAPTAPQAQAWLEDVTGTGVGWERLAQDVLDETLAVGRCGLYVTHTTEEADEARPYAQLIKAESIINWRVAVIGGQPRLAWVVLKEKHSQPDPEDEFTVKPIDQWRVLRLRPMVDGTGQFVVEVWREKKDATTEADKYEIVEKSTPLKRGQPLDHIPFYFAGPTNTEPEAEKPPLLGLVNTNMYHYKVQADYRNILFWAAASTTMYLFGADENTELRVGGSTAVVSSNPDAKIGFAGLEADKAEPLENALNHTEHYMAYQGGRLLAQPKKAVEAEGTHRLRAEAEAVTVQGISLVVGETVGSALTEMVNWGGVEGDVTVGLNTDIVDATMGPQELAAITQAVQSGVMSFETAYHNLQRGELTVPGITAEDERRRIEIQVGAVDVVEGGE